MMAIELLHARHASSPTPPARPRSRRTATSNGVVVLTCGTWGNVFRFLPPLSISDELLEEAFDVVAEAFAATA